MDDLHGWSLVSSHIIFTACELKLRIGPIQSGDRLVPKVKALS